MAHLQPVALEPQNQADEPSVPVERFGPGAPLMLDAGVALAPWQIAYQTYGTLNAQRSNAVLVCHALTGDQHVANDHPVTGKPGWWDTIVGPGLPLDTNRFFIIAANVIGGCMGTTGPASTNPGTGRPWGVDFPLVTIRDMVRSQAMLLDRLGIESLFCVIGGSMGGMQALQWAASYPDRVFAAMPVATGARHSAQNIAFHEVGRQAVMADPDWRGGRYFEHGVAPRKGLAVARMGGHITYLSETALHRKFGRRLQEREAPTFTFDADFQIESYLRHQGITFVERFDANSYLYVTRAMDYFDLAADYGGVLAEAFRGTKTRFCVMSFTSDWLFPTPDRVPSCTRSTPPAPRSASSRSRATRVMTPSSSTSPACSPRRAASSTPRPGAGDRVSEPARLRRPSPAKGGDEGGGTEAFRCPPDATLAVPNLPHPYPLPFKGREILPPRLLLVADMVEPGSRVLDVGCGDGSLLALLRARRGVDGRGIELSREGVSDCLAKGLPVIQGDADTDLADYPTTPSITCPSQTIQATRQPRVVLETCCGSAGGRSCPSRISATGASARRSRSAAACR